jgi:hypothetical protein
MIVPASLSVMADARAMTTTSLLNTPAFNNASNLVQEKVLCAKFY